MMDRLMDSPIPSPNRNGGLHCLAAQQDDHLPNDIVYIDRFPFRCALFEEMRNAPDHIRCACAVLHDSHRSGALLQYSGWAQRASVTRCWRS
jgi:hypothetical protein